MSVPSTASLLELSLSNIPLYTPWSLGNQVSALSGLLFELAAAQHKQDKAEKRVLTAHHGQGVRVFEGPVYTVISIPFATPKQRVATALFASQYNELTATQVDSRALAGEYRAGIEFYELLIHFHHQIWKDRFWTSSDRAVPRGLEQSGRAVVSFYESKLRLLKKLTNGEEIEKSLEEFKQIAVPVVPMYNLHEMNSTPPRKVKSLLEVELP